jgi:mono/diheme cytochrome c family protein
MTRLLPAACALGLIALLVAAPRAAQTPAAAAPEVAAHAGALFTTADNCMACHNNLVTPLGQDVSIGST